MLALIVAIYVVGIPLCGVVAARYGSDPMDDWHTYLFWPVWVVVVVVGLLCGKVRL